MDENIQSASTVEGCAHCNSPAVEQGYPTPLCRDCRQRFIKYPIPRWLYLFAGAIGGLILFSLFSFPKNLSVALHYERGKRAAEKRQFRTAQAELTAFTKAVPDNLEAEGYLVKAAYYNLDLETVFTEWQKLVGKDLDNQKLAGDLNAIGDLLQEYYPGDSLSLIFKQYPDSAGGIPDTALSRYASHHPEEVYTQMLYASRLYEQDRFVACDSLLRLILGKDRLYIPALRMNIGVQRELGNWAASIKSCDDILDINRETSYAVAGKARTFLKQYKDKEGLKFARAAMKMDPKDPYAASTLVLAHHFNQAFKERDALISTIKASHDANMQEALSYVQNIISGKEKFRN